MDHPHSQFATCQLQCGPHPIVSYTWFDPWASSLIWPQRIHLHLRYEFQMTRRWVFSRSGWWVAGWFTWNFRLDVNGNLKKRQCAQSSRQARDLEPNMKCNFIGTFGFFGWKIPFVLALCRTWIISWINTNSLVARVMFISPKHGETLLRIGVVTGAPLLQLIIQVHHWVVLEEIGI